jgi:hypothetical protein
VALVRRLVAAPERAKLAAVACLAASRIPALRRGERRSQRDDGMRRARGARQAVELVLKGHEPNPALAVDRHWSLVAANAVVPLLLDGVAPWLLEPPVNVLRLSLHPEGLGPRLANAGQWRTHLLHRLQQQISASADGELQALHDEIAAYPFAAHGAPATSAVASTVAGHIAVPFELHTDLGTLSFISTITIFGTPVDVTLQELAVESFFPANAETHQALQRLQARHTA